MDHEVASSIKATILNLMDEFLSIASFRSTNSSEDTLAQLKKLEQYIDPNISGFGCTEHEIIEDIIGARYWAGGEAENMPESYQVELLWKKVSVFEDVAIFRAIANLKVPKQGQSYPLEKLRLHYVWKKQSGQWKIISVHNSIPYGEAEDDEAFPIKQLEARNRELEAIVAQRTEALIQEKSKTESLLHNILPVEVAQELLETGQAKPQRFEEVSILFADFEDFTNIVSTIPTNKLITELNDLFSHFDEIIDEAGIEKIKTIGDAYLATCGLPRPCDDHALRVVTAGKKMIDYLEKRNLTSGIKWNIRIGVHSGPIAAGVVGKKKFAYDIFGDTINIASRIETAGAPGRINVSAYTYDLIKNQFPGEYRGKILAKGKGQLDMYFV